MEPFKEHLRLCRTYLRSVFRQSSRLPKYRINLWSQMHVK